MQKIPIRRDSLDQLQDELKQLKTVERPQIIKAISEAREHGDLSENAEYHAARERQSFIEGRVGELEDVISRAEVIDPSMIDGKTVTFGTTIVVADEDTDEENTYTIVGPYWNTGAILFCPKSQCRFNVGNIWRWCQLCS